MTTNTFVMCIKKSILEERNNKKKMEYFYKICEELKFDQCEELEKEYELELEKEYEYDLELIGKEYDLQLNLFTALLSTLTLNGIKLYKNYK